VTAGGTAVVAARGSNNGGTTGVGRGATGGSKPRGISGAGQRGTRVEVPAEVRGPNGENRGTRLTKKI
jgi:hypothetical protein